MRYLTYLFPLFLLFVTACGGGSENQNQTESNTDTQSQSMADQQSSSDVRTIDIIGVDQMKYVVKDEGDMISTGQTIKASDGNSYVRLEGIDANAGEKIRIRLTTKSKLPGSAMSHNYVQLKPSTDLEAFDKAALQAKDNDYIPSDMSNEIIAHTELASGGETVEVTYTVPQEPGEYPFICTFPAHFAAGMRGTMNVQ